MSSLDVPQLSTVAGESKSGIAYKIEGTLLQSVVLELQPGQVIYSDTGAMSWLSANVSMNTHAGSGGIGGMIKRAVSGATLFLVDFASTGGTGLVAFTSDFPGKILPVDLDAGQSLLVQKHAFMCAEKSVGLDVRINQRFGAGLFGGEGFVMQEIRGPGISFLEFDGEIVEYNLQAGQGLRVQPGHVAMFEPTVTFDIEAVQGLGNILLSGTGLFLATLQGPGRIWLQTMPIANLAKRLIPFLPAPQADHHD